MLTPIYLTHASRCLAITCTVPSIVAVLAEILPRLTPILHIFIIKKYIQEQSITKNEKNEKNENNFTVALSPSILDLADTSDRSTQRNTCFNLLF